MVVDGGITDADNVFYGTRARTRPGMIVTGAAVVDPGSARRQRILVKNYNEAVLPGLERRAAIMQSYDVVALGQLIHLRREMIDAEIDFPPVAPSFLRSPRNPFPPQVLDGEQIAAIVESFVRCAANLERTVYHGCQDICCPRLPARTVSFIRDQPARRCLWRERSQPVPLPG